MSNIKTNTIMRYEVTFKKNSTTYQRTLDLKYGSEGEAKEALCHQSADYRDVIILGVRPC